LITLFVIILSNSHIVYGFKHYLNKQEILEEFGKDLYPVLHFPCAYVNKTYRAFYNRTWGVIVLLVFNFIPATIILIGNVTIAADIILRKKRLNKTYPTLHISTVNLQQSCRSRTCSPVLNTEPISIPRIPPVCPQIDNQKGTNNPKGTPRTKNTKVKTVGQHNNEIKNQPLRRLKNQTPPAKASKVKARSPSRMLFTMTIFFMVTSFPYTCFVVLKSQIGELKERDISRWQLLTIVVLILGWCNNALNFFLYFVSGTLFKQEWKRLVKSGKSKFCRMFKR
jgi:hypothetical protein